MGDQIVAAQGKTQVFHGEALRLKTHVNVAVVVAANQIVAYQISGLLGCALTPQIVDVRTSLNRDLAYALGNQTALLGAKHAQRNIRIAAQQVADIVAHHQRHGDVWQSLAHTRQDGRQQKTRDWLAGAETHQALQTRCAVTGHARKMRRTGLHGLGGLGQSQSVRCGLQASACAFKQHHIQLLLQLGNMPSQSGLAQARGPCRAKQAAVFQGRQKRRDQRPVEIFAIHVCISVA